MSSNKKSRHHKKKTSKKSSNSGGRSSKIRSKSDKSHKKSSSSSRSRRKKTGEASSTTVDGTTAPGGTTNVNFEAGRLFGKFDQFQTGKLGKEEFQKLFVHLRQEQQQRQKQSAAASASRGKSAFDLGLMFSTYDKDGSGMLDENKFKALMQNLPAYAPGPSRPVTFNVPNPSARPFHAPLLTKKRKVESNIDQLRARMQEITVLREAIELQATRYYEEVVGRLRSEEAAKLSILQRQIDVHAATVLRIERIEQTMLVHEGGTAQHITTSPEYLRLYPDIQQLLSERTSLKIVSKCLHNETAVRTQKLKAYEVSTQALRVKDNMIWILLQERKRFVSGRSNYTEAIDKLSQASSREIEQWIELVDRATAEIEHARLSIAALKQKIRRAQTALSSRNFETLRQLLKIDHNNDDLVSSNISSVNMSREIAGLVVSSENADGEV